MSKSTSNIFWMTSKRSSECHECEGDICADDRMVWDSDKYKAYCASCGVDLIGDDPQQSNRLERTVKLI